MKKNIKSIKTCTAILIPVVLGLLSGLSCKRNLPAGKEVSSLVAIDTSNLPAQPGEDTWHFIEDLKSPMWTKLPWGTEKPGSQDADLSAGVKIKTSFPGPRMRLETAYSDLHKRMV